MKETFIHIKYVLGLMSWALSVFCLAIIGIKSAVKHGGIFFFIFEDMSAFDKKIAKFAAICFIFGVLFFVWGIISE